jgi:hypothetical protein
MQTTKSTARWVSQDNITLIKAVKMGFILFYSFFTALINIILSCDTHLAVDFCRLHAFSRKYNLRIFCSGRNTYCLWAHSTVYFGR